MGWAVSYNWAEIQGSNHIYSAILMKQVWTGLYKFYAYVYVTM